MYFLAWAVVISGYLAFSVFAACMTRREHQRNCQVNRFVMGISYLLCLAWPVAAIVLFAFAQMQPAEFPPADQG